MAGPPDDTLPAEALEDEALAWVVRLTSGEADEAERAAFLQWRDQSPRHARALAEARDLWTLTGPALVAGQERRLAEDLGREPLTPASARPQPRPRPRLDRRTLVGLAASLVLAVGVGLAVAPPTFADISTRDGQTITRVLADGSRVTLAPGTALDVDFPGDGSRRATIRRGEVLFDVAHDPARPFAVRSGEGETTVLGTAFSVKRSGGLTRVAVLRGRVEVRSGSETRILEPDRSVTYGLTAMGSIRAVDADAALAWARGWLFFENRSIGEVVAELDRHRGETVVVLNRKVAARRIGGAIDLAQSDRWLAALETSEDVSVTRLPGLIIIR